jgi:hypothetical protein
MFHQLQPYIALEPIEWIRCGDSYPPERILSISMFDPRQGGLGGPSSMYNTPQNLLTEIQFNAQTLFRRPINVCQSSSLAPTCNRERIGEMKMRKSYVEW